MKSESYKPIPIPTAQRLHHARKTLVPALVFFGAVATIALIWKDHIAAPSMVGQAEPVVASVCSHLAGTIAGLNVNRFQQVKAGDTLGRVMVADPKLVETSLAVFRSEIDLLRNNLQLVLPEKRFAVDAASLRLSWMRQRADLASAKVTMQLAKAELQRAEELIKDKIVSASEYDLAKSNYEAQEQQVAELTRLVAEGETAFKALNAKSAGEQMLTSSDPIPSAIATAEAKLRMTEAQLDPVTLRSPIDGVVSAILMRSGESVTAGMPIVTIASATSTRIVGYLRPPLIEDPKPGMSVEVRTRGAQRLVGRAQIIEVGAQFEPVPLALQGSIKLAGSDLALPVDISVPANMNIRPGELVDLVLVPSTD